MTRPTRKSLKRRLDDLDEGGDGGSRIEITETLVDRDGECAGVIGRLRVWSDEAGEWYSEVDRFAPPVDPEDIDDLDDVQEEDPW